MGVFAGTRFLPAWWAIVSNERRFWCYRENRILLAPRGAFFKSLISHRGEEEAPPTRFTVLRHHSFFLISGQLSGDGHYFHKDFRDGHLLISRGQFVLSPFFFIQSDSCALFTPVCARVKPEFSGCRRWPWRPSTGSWLTDNRAFPALVGCCAWAMAAVGPIPILRREVISFLLFSGFSFCFVGAVNVSLSARNYEVGNVNRIDPGITAGYYSSNAANPFMRYPNTPQSSMSECQQQVVALQIIWINLFLYSVFAHIDRALTAKQ